MLIPAEFHFAVDGFQFKLKNAFLFLLLLELSFLVEIRLII